MTYKEVLKYFNSLEIFNPVKALKNKETTKGGLLFDLNNIKMLCEEAGNPQDKLKCIHIAGTNGKGSVTSFLSNILFECGLKCAAYTSPWLIDRREQITINGEIISEDDFADVMTEAVKYAKNIKDISASEFELTTFAAFLYFKKHECDICIIETGLGGEFDATNIIKSPVLCIFTPISMDHESVLGDTLKKITMVKSGIIKKGSMVLSAMQESDVLEVLQKKCIMEGCNLIISPDPETAFDTEKGLVFDIRLPLEENYKYLSKSLMDSFKKNPRINLNIHGLYQSVNANLACIAAMMLGKMGYNFDIFKLRQGLEKTYRPARFELLSNKPDFFIDGGHNPAGIQALILSLEELYKNKKNVKYIFIAGVLADKDYISMIKPVSELTNRIKNVFTITPNNIRALDADELTKIFESYGIEAKSCISVFEAVNEAVGTASCDDVICAFGSLYYMGEVKEAHKKLIKNMKKV